MALQLIEVLVPDASERDRLAGKVAAVVQDGGGRVIESTFASDLARLYVIVDSSAPTAIEDALRRADFRVALSAAVRLVGEPPKASSPSPSHLVEWDLPSNLKMDQYLLRKAEKTPLYANVPEVKFLRTYVREDMVKCVCLYDAPDEAAVRRAREAVGAPVDRLSRLASPSDDD